MGISTVSFNKAKIFKNRMFFSEYGRNSNSLCVLDNSGNSIIRRVSYKPVKNIENDTYTITRKIEYEMPDKNTCYEIIKRIYNKAGQLLDVRKEFCKYA